VTLEGIEGSGKSTLGIGLVQKLTEAGHAPLMTREPGGSELGNEIRSLFLARRPRIPIDPLAEAFLVNAARAQHVVAAIAPALAAGRVVLCDRFVDSTLAYQGYGRGLEIERLRQICTLATRGLLPDVTLLLDVPVAVSRARLGTRGGEADRLESEPEEFHERVRAGFLALATVSPRFHTLDGNQPPERTLEAAWRIVAAQLESARA
jgi:dTMP kinase